ncbi:hypothetical protein IV102_16555 [bacterium]|nr:hypothetical protein [bacterium]
MEYLLLSLTLLPALLIALAWSALAPFRAAQIPQLNLRFVHNELFLTAILAAAPELAYLGLIVLPAQLPLVQIAVAGYGLSMLLLMHITTVLGRSGNFRLTRPDGPVLTLDSLRSGLGLVFALQFLHGLALSPPVLILFYLLSGGHIG